MDPIARMVAAGAAGAAGSGPGLYVDEVFSTFLYDGAGGTQTITNGIDLSGEGGLVWIKRRDGLHGHRLTDTERGATKALESSSTDYERTHSTGLTAFNSDGFSLGSNAKYNGSGYEMSSWSFRKAPGFFDVVTYTGNGSNRTIAHNLGSVPGMIFIKRYSDTEDWTCYHRSVGATHYLQLNKTDHARDLNLIFNDTEPTSSVFTVGTHDRVNTNGESYVAYIFAHDDQSFGTNGDEAIIKCGTYTGNGTYDGVTVDVGFEPQFLIIKSGLTGDWVIHDMMNNMALNSSGQGDHNGYALRANTDDAEDFVAAAAIPTGTGFLARNRDPNVSSGTEINENNEAYYYMAIRRPNKPPTAATDVFDLKNRATNSSDPNTFATSLIYVDGAWHKMRSGGSTNGVGPFLISSRLTGSTYLQGNVNNATTNLTNPDRLSYRFNYKVNPYNWTTSSNPIESDYLFRRAPGFFDVVVYRSITTTTYADIAHNLGVQPELVILKNRSATTGWRVWSTSLSKVGILNGDHAFYADTLNLYSSEFYNTDPTATTFRIGTSSSTNDQSGYNYVAYLFASLDGISKVGTYSGTGNNINVDCGFTAGARFVMIKRTDTRISGSTGWYIWDTESGIVSGNDPYVLVNEDAAEVTNTDYIDPLNAGFTVTSSAPAGINASGGEYLFLAIA